MSSVNYWMISNQITNRERSKYVSFDMLSKLQGKLRSFYGIGDLNDHYSEIPLWIAQVEGLLQQANPYLKSSIRIITTSNIKEIKVDPNSINIFSVMKSNIKHLVNAIPKFPDDSVLWIGGYNIPELVQGLRGTTIHAKISYFNDLDALKRKLLGEAADTINGSSMYITPNFNLFKGVKVIPRIALSRGCKNNCSFCTIPKCVTFAEYSYDDVLLQIDTLNGLTFEYVYVDDKTFGQGANHIWLKGLYDKIIQFNSTFKGFIIQTTSNLLDNNKFITTLVNSHVKFVEVGIESYNDRILQLINKGTTVSKINSALHKLKQTDIKVIPNIIIGIPNETFEEVLNTAYFIRDNKFDLVNLTLYTDYSLNQSQVDYQRIFANPLNESFVNILALHFMHQHRSYYSLNQSNNLIL